MKHAWQLVKADETVPLEDSRRLAEATGIALQLVDGGSHGLGAIVRDGRLVEWLRRVAHSGKQ